MCCIEFSEKTDAFSYGVCMYEIVLGLLVSDVLMQKTF
jgi:hypothetical protein